MEWHGNDNDNGMVVGGKGGRGTPRKCVHKKNKNEVTAWVICTMFTEQNKQKKIRKFCTAKIRRITQSRY